MDRLSQLMEVMRRDRQTMPCLLGVLNVLIGRRITTTGGVVLSAGLSWREVAALLKKVRWDKNAVRQLGLEPARLPTRDREQFWFAAIRRAGVDSPAAHQAGDQVAEELRDAGYLVGPGPSAEAQ